MNSASGLLSALASASPLSSLTRESDELLTGERVRNPLFTTLRNDEGLRETLLDASRDNTNNSVMLYLVLPQSSTLRDVEITAELVETHLVNIERSVSRCRPRAFTSLNGLHGTCQPGGEITVHGRLRRATDPDSALGANVGGWEHATIRGSTVLQLESQVVVLRESQLQASAQLPLATPVGLMLVSDPLYFPGCGWKLPLALRRCCRRFAHVNLDELPLSDLPNLLSEYQVLARAWREGTLLAEECTELSHGRPPPPTSPPSLPETLTAAAVAAAAEAASTAATVASTAAPLIQPHSSRLSSPLTAGTRVTEALLRIPAAAIAKAPSPSAFALLRNLLGPELAPEAAEPPSSAARTPGATGRAHADAHADTRANNEFAGGVPSG